MSEPRRAMSYHPQTTLSRLGHDQGLLLPTASAATTAATGPSLARRRIVPGAARAVVVVRARIGVGVVV